MSETKEYPLKEETGQIINLAYEIKKHLGNGLLEIIYKDAFEIEFENNGLLFQREKEFKIIYKENLLPRPFYADFIVFDKVILEVKAKASGIDDNDIAQVMSYLKMSKCKIALIINFGKDRFQIKRVIM
jgi:GxxExxY protein